MNNAAHGQSKYICRNRNYADNDSSFCCDGAIFFVNSSKTLNAAICTDDGTEHSQKHLKN